VWAVSANVPPLQRPTKFTAFAPAHCAVAELLEAYQIGGYGRCTGGTDSRTS
jgi:hypothetical protein